MKVYHGSGLPVTCDLCTKTFNSINLLIPIYLHHLMSCDYLLWIYQKKSSFHYKIIQKNNLSSFNWDINKFSFTKNIGNWNESCTVKYNEISLGEFQLENLSM